MVQIDRTEFLHLLQKLDHIERMVAGAVLSRPEGAEKTSLISRLNRLPLPLQWLAGGVASWGISSAIGAYLASGKDPLALLEFLFKLFV